MPCPEFYFLEERPISEIIAFRIRISVKCCEYKTQSGEFIAFQTFFCVTCVTGMRNAFKTGLLLCLLAVALEATAQRTYKAHSVLNSGEWYKIAVRGPGVYRLDMGFLKSLGLPQAIPSAQLQLFGRREVVLPEAVAAPRTDDFEEISIQTVDGGDGILNNADYALFFAEGPHQWVFDSANNRFGHRKNLYAEQRFFYITVGAAGKRISTQTVVPNPSVTFTTFDERFFHELDSVNFLASGKEWFGEEFRDAPGQTLSHSLPGVGAGAVPNTPVTVITAVAARSVGSGSQFSVQLNNDVVQQITIPAIAGGLYSPFAQEARQQSTTLNAQGGITLTYTFGGGGFNAQGWLNWVEIFYKRQARLPESRQLAFRDLSSAGRAAVGFTLAAADAATQVWDVTDPFVPVAMQGRLSGSTFSFAHDATQLREYMGFSKSLVPEAVGRVANQDLHNTTETDYFIITHPLFAAQAQRLAQFHQTRNGIRTTIVTPEQIFNEFSGGIPDPAALRDFVKMYYDKYRATWTQSGKYLLLFGKGSFDYKSRIANNTAFVPAYESAASLDPLATYTSDDFFGFLDDGEDAGSAAIINNLDIGTGRVPATTADEAAAFADKVEAYHTPQAFGPWRASLSFVADDEDNNLHLEDAEILTVTSQARSPLFNIQKIYLDAFRQEGGPAGGRYPQANEVSNNALYNGTLIWNYSGHGGPFRLAEEVVLDQQIVNNLANPYRLPLLITATCDFAPYDNPLLRSLGEDLLIRPKTGAIALTTTTRVVFAFSNRILNNNYLQTALQRGADGAYKTLGEALRIAKNITYQTGTDVVNNRKFALLGDPAMTLAFPTLNVAPTTINGMDISKSLDTLSATENVVLAGEVRTNNGAVVNDFNGTVYLSLFDKPQIVTTLGNDPGSQPASFQTQTALLFRGKASATSGLFRFQFRLPKDLNYAFGRGKISLYAEDGKQDGGGASDSVVIGGIATGGNGDAEGPVVKAYLNDENFVSGGIVNTTPVLLVKLFDSSGINSSSAGIGHDLTATLDGNPQTYYVLNDFYESDLDSAQKGTIRFQLPELAAGPHTLTIKAWDILNNSSGYELAFTIVPTANLEIAHVLNYPNPFTTRTAFWFEHNQPGADLYVKVDVFTVTGRRIKTLAQTINTAGNRSSEMEWDGRDETGAKVGRGVYLYHLQVRAASGQTRAKWERLVLLN